MLYLSEWHFKPFPLYICSGSDIRHEWPGPVGTLIRFGLAWAVHDGYDNKPKL